MELTFTKLGGKYDQLIIHRDDGATETVSCPKQGIIPHDMVHFAVESVLAHRGFLSLVQAGKAVDFGTSGGESEEAVERLVETFQAEMWGGRVTAEDLLGTYEHACEARGHGAAAVSQEDVSAIRERLDDLTRQWATLGTNEAMTVRF
jgi:hypothetical protein